MKRKAFLSLLFFIFVLLLIATWSASSSLHKNTALLNDIQNTLLRLSALSVRLDKNVQNNQANVLKALVRRDATLQDAIGNTSLAIEQTLTRIIECVEDKKNVFPAKAFTIVQQIRQRLKTYKQAEKTVISLLHANDGRYDDALVSFNAIATAFTNDVAMLVTLSNDLLRHKVDTLRRHNLITNRFMYGSFALSVVLLSIMSVLTLRYQVKTKNELNRAVKAESEAKELRRRLEHYNKKLQEEIQEKKSQLYERIYTNTVSRLPNRNKLIEDIQQNRFRYLSVLNIDNFQKFNDVYGEEYGNVALRMSAEFLSDFLHERALLYHIGGDEFVIAVAADSELSKEEFVELVKSILKEYRKTEFSYQNTSFVLNMSAGITFGGLQKMLAYADMALKDAKRKNIHLEIYQGKALEEIHKEDIECHKKLLWALEHDRIVAFFQPIVPIQNPKESLKYESLVRLIDENGSIHTPVNFLRIAKQNRIYYKITASIFTKVLATIQEHKIAVSLNLSMADVTNQKTTQMIYDALARFSHCNLLTFELLETEDFSDYKTVYDFCVQVKSYGVSLSLDDFGSGYSNFAHIIHLPVDYIKIDASLISNITRDYASRILVDTIVQLAKKIKAKTIAEFVSSRDILEIVQELGVDYAQGFYLGKPAPIEEHMQNPVRLDFFR